MSLCFSIALVKSDIYAKNSFLVYIILRKGFSRKKIIVADCKIKLNTVPIQ